MIKQRLEILATTKPKKKTKLPGWLKNPSGEIPLAEISRIAIMAETNEKLAKRLYKTMLAHIKGKKLINKGWAMMHKHKTGPKHEKGYQMYRNGIATINSTRFQW